MLVVFILIFKKKPPISLLNLKIKMKTTSIIFLTTFLAINLPETHTNNLMKVSRVSREALVSCNSGTCKDCLGNCDDCDQCKFCKLTVSVCSKGKELKFGGEDVCEKCKYCVNGIAHCKKQCSIGQAKEVCKSCRANCI